MPLINQKTNQKGKIFALIGTFVGASITFVVLFFLNAKLIQEDKKKHTKVSGLKIAKIQPKKQITNKPKPKKKKQKKRSNQPAPDLPVMSSSIQGASFGLDSMAWLSSDDLSDKLLGQAKNLVMTADTVDVPPEVASMPVLSYPAQARKQGVQGYVKINILVGKNGQVKKTQILEAEPSGVFETVALAAIKQWKFQPARYQGESVQVWSQQVIRFDLN